MHFLSEFYSVLALMCRLVEALTPFAPFFIYTWKAWTLFLSTGV